MCLGGILSHERRMQFRSPFINLMIPANEYVDMLCNLKDNIHADITDITGENKYPVGLLAGKYHLHFIHYNDFESAVTVWRKRCERMDYQNLYVILVQTASCSNDDIVKFDSLPFKNKVALTSDRTPKLSCTFRIKGYDGLNLNGEILSAKGRLGKPLYEQFNWNNFFRIP